MIIVIGGQLGKHEIEKCLRDMKVPGLEVEVKDDMSASMDIKSGRADYYLGACLTGGGGALAMAIAMLGYGSCKALASSDAEAISNALDAGIRAFGFTPQLTNQVVPVIVREIMKRS